MFNRQGGGLALNRRQQAGFAGNLIDIFLYDSPLGSSPNTATRFGPVGKPYKKDRADIYFPPLVRR
jgi:hypothetical protein